MICEIICVDGFLCMSHLDIVYMLFAYLHVQLSFRTFSTQMHIVNAM